MLPQPRNGLPLLPPARNFKFFCVSLCGDIAHFLNRRAIKENFSKSISEKNLDSYGELKYETEPNKTVAIQQS